jgi:hypothetical protein
MEEMMYEVYLSDWLYNAGIVGFLKILLGDQKLDEQALVKIRDNYIRNLETHK